MDNMLDYRSVHFVSLSLCLSVCLCVCLCWTDTVYLHLMTDVVSSFRAHCVCMWSLSVCLSVCLCWTDTVYLHLMTDVVSSFRAHCVCMWSLSVCAVTVDFSSWHFCQTKPHSHGHSTSVLDPLPLRQHFCDFWQFWNTLSAVSCCCG